MKTLVTKFPSLPGVISIQVSSQWKPPISSKSYLASISLLISEFCYYANYLPYKYTLCSRKFANRRFPLFVVCIQIIIYYIRLLLVGNLFQLHRPHQIWLPHEYCHYCHYYVIIQRISLNIHKIRRVFEMHALTLTIMHCFDVLT